MDRLLIITGASSGIGAALAEAASDVTVASVSRRPGPGDHLEIDLSDPGSWPRFDRWMRGLIDSRMWDWVGLVNSAATLAPMGFAGEVDSDAYARNVILNSAAPQVIGDLFLGAMAGHTASGSLCLISSGAALTPYPGWSSYCAAKAAGDQWARVVGAEQAERGGRIKVMSVAPGVVDTDMQASIREMPVDRFPQVARFHALHEGGQLQDPALVGARLWQLIQRTDLDNGAVLDLRSLS